MKLSPLLKQPTLRDAIMAEAKIISAEQTGVDERASR